MAENYTNQVVVRDGVQYAQVLLDGRIVNEFPLPTATGSKPTEPQKPADNAEPEAKTEAPASTEAPATAETTEKKKKGLSAKAKTGLAIAGGMIGCAFCYVLGERRGHDSGTAEGYASGYADANAAASTDVEATDQTTWEAPE